MSPTRPAPAAAGSSICIGEDVSERLDVIPAQFKVIVTRRPKYACRACAGEVVQAPAPERLIENGMPTEALVAHVLVAKYADHMPLYRQAQIYARQGITLDRSTLADWVGRAAFALAAGARPAARAAARNRPSCSPTRRRCRCSIPGAAAPRRASCGPMRATSGRGAAATPPAVAYRLCAGPQACAAGPASRRLQRHRCRSTATAPMPSSPRPATSCSPSAGAMCGGSSTISRPDTPAPIATEALVRIAALYAVEADIRGLPADERRQARQQRSKPLVEALQPWLEGQLAAVSGKSTIAEAIRYALSRWDGLSRFLDDGRVEIDSNVVERAIRPIALGRKNHLFAGSDGGGEHWAVIASLIETCKMNDVDPQAYLRDVLARIVARHPMSRIDESCCRSPTSPAADKAAA